MVKLFYSKSRNIVEKERWYSLNICYCIGECKIIGNKF